jgi:hypothetical protein
MVNHEPLSISPGHTGDIGNAVLPADEVRYLALCIKDSMVQLGDALGLLGREVCVRL